MKLENRDNVTILSVGFGLDAVTVPNLKEAVQEIAKTGGIKLLIDMEKTLHVDSSGLSALLRFQKVLREYQGEMKIARVHPQVLKIIKLTGINEFIEIHDTLENAVKSFCESH